jgi:hypothetical protein
MVWNPARGMPTMVHDTIEQASAEAERLTRQNPGEHFIIMSPVLTDQAATVGKVWSDGARYAQSRIDAAEANVQRMVDDAIQYEAKVKRRFAVIERDQRRFQAIVADCLLWFDGFRAAHSPKDSWERPHVPDREALRELNAALQALETPQPEFEEIPF